jgi:hypothetical protein
LDLEEKLTIVLDNIDYRKTIDPVENGLQSIAAKLRLEKNRVGSKDEVDQILAEYTLCLMDRVISAPRHVLADFDINRGEAFKYLAKHYNWDTVYDIAMSGAEGGLMTLMNIICKEMAIDYANRVISSHVSEFWDSLTPSEQVAVSDIYLHKFAKYLPRNQPQYRTRVKMRFWEVLKQHPAMMKRMQGSVQ